MSLRYGISSLVFCGLLLETSSLHPQALGADDTVPATGLPAATEAKSQAAYQKGEAVQVQWEGTWYDAHVLEVIDATHWKISYKNYGSKWDEVVGPDRIRSLNMSASPLTLTGQAITGEALRKGFPMHFYQSNASTPVLGSYFFFYYLENASEQASGTELHSNAWDQVFAIPGGNRIAHAMGDTLRIWDLDTGEEVRRFRQPLADSPERRIWHFGASPDGRYLYTSRGDGNINPAYAYAIDPQYLSVWDIESGEEVHQLKGSLSTPRTFGPIAVSPDGSLLGTFVRFSSRKDRSTEHAVFRIYRTTDWSILRELKIQRDDDPFFHNDSYSVQDWNAKFSIDGKAIYSLGPQDLYRWKFLTEDRPQPLSLPDGKSIDWYTLSPDGRYLATYGNAGSRRDGYRATVTLRSTADLSELRRWEVEGSSSDIPPLFDHSSRFLIVSISDRESAVLDVATGDVVGASDNLISAVTTDGRLGISSRGYVMRIPSGRSVGRLFPLPGGRHGATAVEGPFFTASPETMTLIRDNVDDVNYDGKRSYANTPQRKESNEAFLAAFNPQKVALVLQGVDPAKVRELPQEYRLPNVVLRTTAVRQDSVDAHLDVESDETDATLQDVHLVRSDSELPESTRQSLDSAIASGSNSFPLTIPFPPGKNEMTLRAVVTDSYGVESKPAVLTVERPEHVEELAGRLFVLAVGVSKYKYPEYTLKYSAADAEAIAAALKKQEGLTFGEVHTQVYVNKQATIENVKSGLDWLKRVATADDVAVVFFSGHGLQARAGLYYLTHEGDSEAIQYTCLNWVEVAKALQETKARQTVFLSDACHAGAFAKTQLAMQAELAKSLQEIDRVLVFASSEGEEVSLEHDDWGHGAFTKALLEGLDRHADTNRDDAVTVAELIDWTTKRVVSLTNRNQHPYLPKPEGYDADLIIARSRPAEAKIMEKKEPPSPPASGATADRRFGVLTHAANVMDGNNSLGRVLRGTRFQIERTHGSWLFGTFTIDSGTVRGWVKADFVRQEAATRVNPEATRVVPATQD